MLDNLKVELDKFRKAVIQQSRSNLTRTRKNASKRLYDSLKSNLKISPNSFQLDFTMEDYGEFQDRGVKGVKSGSSLSNYSYKSKMPPPKAFDKWIVRRGLAPRNKSGQFLSRKTLQFLIARKVFLHGIKPSMFFTKPFENEYKKLSDNIIKAYGLDMTQFLSYTLTNYKK
mgnify:CR=1 FL=1